MWPSRLKILFCVQIFFGLCNVIVSNEDFLKFMSVEERKSIFGTEDGSIPKCKVVEWVRPSRSKRSGNGSVNIPINAFGFLNPTLYVVDDDHLINRRRTGIWAADYSPIAHQNVSYHPRPQIFDDIGDFELLQNAEEGSAITRFWDSNGNENIVGYLKQNYTVRNVPREFEYVFLNINRSHVLSERSVDAMNDQDKQRLFLTICENAGVPQEYYRHHTYTKTDVRPDRDLHRPRRQITNFTKVPDVVYPKLLVIPDFATMNHYKSVRDFMVQLIAQLNYVDMLYRQLKDPEVHLSITGIIMPSTNEATPYMSQHIGANNGTIGDAALYATENNFRNENRRFPENTWELILLLTTNPILYYTENKGHFREVNGLSSIASSCSGTGGIARFTEDIKGIFTIAHQLGHLLGAKHEQADAPCKDVGSYLMDNSYDHSAKLEWSNCSRAAFQTHFRSHAKNCRYLRIWGLPDTVKRLPGAWLSMSVQCDNRYKDSTGPCAIDQSPDCFIYGCERIGMCDWLPDAPQEGMLLFDEHGLRACLNNTMVRV